MTKKERLERFEELILIYSVRDLADMIVQLEEYCEKQDKKMAELRQKLSSR